MTWGFVAGSAAMRGWEQRSLINQAPPLRCPLQGSRFPGPVRVSHRGHGGCNVLRVRCPIRGSRRAMAGGPFALHSMWRRLMWS